MSVTPIDQHPRFRAKYDPFIMPLPSPKERIGQLSMEIENFNKQLITIAGQQREILEMAKEMKKDMDDLDANRVQITACRERALKEFAKLKKEEKYLHYISKRNSTPYNGGNDAA